jgi:hypothetical protein
VSPPSPGARTCPRLLPLGRLRPATTSSLETPDPGSAQSGSLAHAAPRPAPRQIRVRRSADNTGHSGRIALPARLQTLRAFSTLSAGSRTLANQARTTLPSCSWSCSACSIDGGCPTGPSAAPTWRRTSDPRLWATYWATRSGARSGAPGPGPGWVPVGGTRGPPFRTRACSALGRSSR